MQWRDRLAQRDSCRTMDWPNYFPIDFLAFRVTQDPHEQYRMSGLEPYASDSRGRLFCTVLKSHVISAHYTGIKTESPLCVFVCHFLSSLVHTNLAKWVWLSNFLRKSSDFKMVMHFQMVYLRSRHMCVLYGQISTIVLFVNSRCPWKHGSYHGKVKKLAALPWCTNEALHQPY